jgi:hypothetical protein
MRWNDNHNVEQEKTKFLTKIGCFFSVVTLGLFVVIVIAWFISSSQETQLKVSRSPNKTNSIEIVKKDDFPDPTIRINYDNKSIIKTNIPEKITVEWKNDYEAVVILTKQGRERETIKLKFKQ